MVTAATPVTKRFTVDDLLSLPDDGRLRELVDGRVVEWDVTTYWHGFFIITLGRILGNFVRERRLGQVVGADPLVRIQGSPFDARGADVAFVSRRRRPADVDAATMANAPDFVIEVLFPSDRAADVQAKVRDWLRAGVRLLWYVDPVAGTTSIYHAGRIAVVGPDDTLDGADVLPGFTLRLQDMLDELNEINEGDDMPTDQANGAAKSAQA